MARGRMITHLICKDKKVNALSDDTCRLLFTWLITTADCEGRTYGDAAIVRSMIFPRRHDMSVEQVEVYLVELDQAALIQRYTVNDEQYIFFPSFFKNQIGLRKDREAPSELPAPPVRSGAGVSPEQIPVKLIEVNGIEVNRNEINSDGAIGALSSCFERTTKITLYKPKEWTEAIRTMFDAGITPDELEETIRDMKFPKAKGQIPLTISGPWSCLKTAIARHANNNGNNSLGIDRSQYEQA